MRLLAIPVFVAVTAILWDLAVDDYVTHAWIFAGIFGLLGLVAAGLLAIVTNP